jgi:hypothetical protein
MTFSWLAPSSDAYFFQSPEFSANTMAVGDIVSAEILSKTIQLSWQVSALI